jgi:hypothetical protein
MRLIRNVTNFNQVADVQSGGVEVTEVKANVVPVSFEEIQQSLQKEDGTVKEGGQAILDAVKSGFVIAENADVSRNIGEGASKKKVSRDYIRLTATNLDGALALVGGKEESVWEKFNIGYDMGVRSTLGQQIVRDSEGPERYIPQLAKYFAKVVPGITPEQAEAHIKAMLASGALTAESMQAQVNAAG